MQTNSPSAVEMLKRLRDAAVNTPVLDSSEDWTKLIEEADTALKAPVQVWVLRIEHRHGADTSVYRTQESADQALHDYVRKWWDEECEGRVMPSEASEAIDEYFEHVADEFAYINCEIIRD